MAKVSAIVFLLWCVNAMVQLYTGPDMWRALLNGGERIMLPVYVLMGCGALWAAAGAVGGIAARILSCRAQESKLFVRLFFVLLLEGYWALRNFVLPAIPIGSPTKLAVLAGITSLALVVAVLITRTVAEKTEGREARGVLRSLPGLIVVLAFAAVTYYVFIPGQWSFHLFQEGSAGGTANDSTADMPNLVLVTLDTTSANYSALYGYGDINTPVLSGIAARGAAFDNAFAPMPMTAPSHSSMMTGFIPRTHGVTDNEKTFLSGEFTTLAEMLSDRGWTTAQFVNFQVCSTPGGLHQGFGTAYNSFSNMAPFQNAIRRSPIFDMPIHVAEKFRRRMLSAGEKDENYVLVREWIAARAAAPFFLWYHIFIPHLPYEPPDYAMNELSYSVSRPFDDNEIIASVKQGRQIPPDRVEELKKMYAAEILHADTVLGRIMDDLDGAGLMGNTLVVVSGDHGEAIYEHDNVIGHAEQVYDSTLRVPLVIAWKGNIPESVRIGTPVSLTDLFPTILDLMSINPVEGIQGVSRKGLLLGDSGYENDEIVFSEAVPPAAPEHLISASTAEYHFIYRPDNPEDYELYLRSGDPFEKNDLSRNPEMKHKIQWLKETVIKWDAGHPVANKPGRRVDRKMRERLKDLGYLK